MHTMEKEILNKIEILQGDITRLKVDAIVNAANSSLLGGSGVDGAIHRAAGPELLAECRTIGGCPAGEARITMGYNLLAKYVIHTVGPVYKNYEKIEAEKLLAACYQSCLSLAAEYSISSVGFPAISCGVYGYPIEEACRIAIDNACCFLKENDTPDKITVVLFSSSDYEAYNKYLKSR